MQGNGVCVRAAENGEGSQQSTDQKQVFEAHGFTMRFRVGGIILLLRGGMQDQS